MDVKVAAHSTKALIAGLDSLKAWGPACAAVTAHHLLEMLSRIESGEITGEKAHRWLGWVQGAICARGAGSLEEFKTINHQS